LVNISEPIFVETVLILNLNIIQLIVVDLNNTVLIIDDDWYFSRFVGKLDLILLARAYDLKQALEFSWDLVDHVLSNKLVGWFNIRKVCLFLIVERIELIELYFDFLIDIFLKHDRFVL